MTSSSTRPRPSALWAMNCAPVSSRFVAALSVNQSVSRFYPSQPHSADEMSGHRRVASNEHKTTHCTSGVLYNLRGCITGLALHLDILPDTTFINIYDGCKVYLADSDLLNDVQIPSKIGSLFHNLGDKYSYHSLHAVDALFTEPSGVH